MFWFWSYYHAFSAEAKNSQAASGGVKPHRQNSTSRDRHGITD
jgi:hypothetical protein